MAAGYACQFGDDNHPAQWLITHLQPPGTITVCEDDFPMAVIHLLAVQLGADPEKLYDTVKRHVDREAAKAAKAEAKDGELAGHPGIPNTPRGVDRILAAERAAVASTPDAMITQAEIEADDAVQDIIAATGEPTHEATGEQVAR